MPDLYQQSIFSSTIQVIASVPKIPNRAFRVFDLFSFHFKIRQEIYFPRPVVSGEGLLIYLFHQHIHGAWRLKKRYG